VKGGKENERTNEDWVKNSVGSDVGDGEFRVEEVGERSETLVEILESATKKGTEGSQNEGKRVSFSQRVSRTRLKPEEQMIRWPKDL